MGIGKFATWMFLLVAGALLLWLVTRSDPEQFVEPPVQTGFHLLVTDEELKDLERSALDVDAAPGGSTYRTNQAWQEDRALVSSIMNQFAAEFPAWSLHDEVDVTTRAVGTANLRDGIGESGGTDPALQVRESEFSSLSELEKLHVGYLLQKVSRFDKRYGAMDLATLPPEELAKVEHKLRTESLFWPPEMVIESAGARDRLNDPAYLKEVQALRVELITLAAPSLAKLEHYQRFSLKAVMMCGVDARAFLYDRDTVVVAPASNEERQILTALHEEFFLRCQSLRR